MHTGMLCRNGQTLRRISLADNYFLRLRGLIGRDVQTLGGLLIRPCHQIHTFYMGYAIDVVYLDRSGKVVRVDPAVAAGRMCAPVKGAVMTLELPALDAAALGIHKGDRLTLIDQNVF